jgi:hypothetical protein
MYRHSQLVLITLIVIFVTGCQKEIRTDTGLTVISATRVRTASEVQLASTCSELRLVASNAKNTAVRFDWPAFRDDGAGEIYALEADIAGGNFRDPMEIGHTAIRSIEFSVARLNELLRRRSIPGVSVEFEFRIRMKHGCTPLVYSSSATMRVSTYDVLRELPVSSTMFICANFRNWQLPTEDKLVSVKNDEEYEGFINMPDPSPQFVLVKYAEDNKDLTIYTDMRDGRFGKGYYAFDFVGAGIYKINLSGGTSQWSYNRIENFSLYGDATGKSDLLMEYESKNQTWSVVANLDAGSFYFRANHADKIKLGADAAAGAIRSNGDPISVNTAGRYKIILSVLTPGNYKYGLQRMS